MPPESNRGKIHRLSDPQKMKLLDAFRTFHPTALEERLIAEEVAQRLSQLLGFTVTRPHVHHACVALGLDLHRSHATRVPADQTVIEKVDGQFAQVRQELQTLRGEAGAHSQRYSALEARVTNAVQAQHNLATAIDGLKERLDRLEKALGGVPA